MADNLAVRRGGEGELEVDLVRGAGFAGEAPIWLEGMPPAVAVRAGRFSADQLFGPSADGADTVIPKHVLGTGSPESLPLAIYPIRVLGTPTAEESSPDRRVVEARSALIMGPLLDPCNFVRGPRPAVGMEVVEPTVGGLTAAAACVTLLQGGQATLEVAGVDLPQDAPPTFRGLPDCVSAEMHTHGPRFTVWRQPQRLL